MLNASRRATPLRTRSRYDRVAYIFLFPAILFLSLMLVIPALATFGFSFTDISFLGPAQFVGLANFEALLHDEVFLRSIANTAYYTVGTVVPTLAVGLIVAIALNRPMRGRGFFRALFYLPVLTSIVAASMIWQYLYNQQLGLFNGILVRLGLPPLGWLTDPVLAMPSLMVMSVWISFGSAMIIYLAAIQGIPGELYEAASIDGANAWGTFWNVTLPSLRPVTFFLLVIQIVKSFQVFSAVYIMTEGGPLNSTTTMVFLMYQNAFQFTKAGYGSAMATVLFLFILAFSIIGSRLVLRNAS